MILKATGKFNKLLNLILTANMENWQLKILNCYIQQEIMHHQYGNSHIDLTINIIVKRTSSIKPSPIISPKTIRPLI